MSRKSYPPLFAKSVNFYPGSSQNVITCLPTSSPGHATVVTCKPVATVQPTAGPPSPILQVHKSIENRSCGIQVDEAGIDMDLLLHVEDMVRTQSSLVLPKSLSFNELIHHSSDSSKPSLITCLQENERYRQALAIQIKINQDLKRLVVGAVSGDGELAKRLVGVSTAEMSHARLLEAAEGASIAADIWRAKCLAGRVVASAAGQRSQRQAKRAEHARHALAHLLGERARLRTSLVEAAEALINANKKPSQSGSVVEHFMVPETLALANLCQKLALGHMALADSGVNVKIVCAGDTPGEHLALEKLLNEIPDVGIQKSQNAFVDASQSVEKTGLPFNVYASTSDLPPSPSMEKDESFIAEALAQFAATKRLDVENICLSCCSRCRGDILIV